jgi:hypothetical protein
MVIGFCFCFAFCLAFAFASACAGGQELREMSRGEKLAGKEPTNSYARCIPLILNSILKIARIAVRNENQLAGRRGKVASKREPCQTTNRDIDLRPLPYPAEAHKQLHNLVQSTKHHHFPPCYRTKQH